MKKKTLLALMISLFAIVSISCDTNSKNENSENTENKPKYDESSPEYQLANILCDCFKSFDENDAEGQFNALECFMAKVEGDSLNDADEHKTKKILKDICPESSANFDKWQTKIQGE